MPATSALARSLGSARRLPGRTPLRVKLIAAVLALVAVALLVISITGISVLRSYLVGRVDRQLQAEAPSALGAVAEYIGGGGPGQGPIAVDWIPSGGRLHRVLAPSAGYGPQTRLMPGPDVPTTRGWLAANGGGYVTVPATSGSGKWRVLLIRDPFATVGGNQGIVVLGADVSTVYATIDRLVLIDLVVSLAIVFLLAIVGTALVRASLRPLTEIERTAQVIAAGDLARRVPDRDPRTEVGRLGRSLNAMLAQIELAFDARARSERAARGSEDRMRQFVADASHELRTPLTAIRGFAEYYRQRGGPGVPGDPMDRAELDRIMRRVEQESSRMGVLVEDMLLLARMDQQRPLEFRPVDLLTLAADAVHDARMMAPARDIELAVRPGAAPLVLGDEVRLRQVIGNLMSNALTHTPERTPVTVRIRPAGREDPLGPGPGDGRSTGDGRRAAQASQAEQPSRAAQPSRTEQPSQPVPAVPAVVLEVADSGPGLTAEQAERAFERFYRADPARTRKAGGAGLGLAIVSALVTAHGGAVWVDTHLGAGATFGIALPLAPEARDSRPDPAEDTAGEPAGHPAGEPAGDTSERPAQSPRRAG